jgi:hypothetical protein
VVCPLASLPDRTSVGMLPFCVDSPIFHSRDLGPPLFSRPLPRALPSRRLDARLFADCSTLSTSTASIVPEEEALSHLLLSHCTLSHHFHHPSARSLPCFAFIVPSSSPLFSLLSADSVASKEQTSSQISLEYAIKLEEDKREEVGGEGDG